MTHIHGAIPRMGCRLWWNLMLAAVITILRVGHREDRHAGF